MNLLLPKTLIGWDLEKGEQQTSEIRGGKYAARIQIGFEKDGSPKYRYFKTQDEYENYLQGRKGKKKKKKDKDKDKKKDKDENKRKDGDTLEEKREKEQKESKKKQESLMTASSKKKKEVETTKKSLQLYLEVNQ